MEKLKNIKEDILSIETFKEQRPDLSIHTDSTIQASINATAMLLNGETGGLIEKCWYETDTASQYFRNEYEKSQIVEAFIVQTQYSINLGNDYTQGGGSYSIGNINSSYSRPESRDVIAPGVLKLLTNARVYNLQVFGINTNGSKQKTYYDAYTEEPITRQIGDMRYVEQLQPNAENGNIAYIGENKLVSWGSPIDLKITTYRTQLIKDWFTGNYLPINEITNLAFFGDDLSGPNSAMTRQQILDLIAGKGNFQNKLVAGDNITLIPNEDNTTTISATGGGGTSSLSNVKVWDQEKTYKSGEVVLLTFYLPPEEKNSREITRENSTMLYISKQDNNRAHFPNWKIEEDDWWIPLKYLATQLEAGDNITITQDNFKTTISATGGISEVAWGSITGTLANQTDLNTILEAKQNKLTAGDNITIENDVISATGGSIDINNAALRNTYVTTLNNISGVDIFKPKIPLNKGDIVLNATNKGLTFKSAFWSSTRATIGYLSLTDNNQEKIPGAYTIDNSYYNKLAATVLGGQNSIMGADFKIEKNDGFDIISTPTIVFDIRNIYNYESATNIQYWLVKPDSSPLNWMTIEKKRIYPETDPSTISLIESLKERIAILEANKPIVFHKSTVTMFGTRDDFEQIKIKYNIDTSDCYIFPNGQLLGIGESGGVDGNSNISAANIPQFYLRARIDKAADSTVSIKKVVVGTNSKLKLGVNSDLADGIQTGYMIDSLNQIQTFGNASIADNYDLKVGSETPTSYKPERQQVYIVKWLNDIREV